MGNAQGIERRIHDEAAHYEGDLCFVSFGAGGCFGRQQPATSGRAEHDGDDDGRGSAEWERSRGLGEPIKGMMAHKPPTATKMKRPCLVSCSLGNCMAPTRSMVDDDDGDQDAHHRGREAGQGESIFSCGFARIGCLGTPAWLNPAPPRRRPEMGSEELQRRVDADLAHLKARQAIQHRHEMKKIASKTKKAKKAKKKRESGDVEISGPHLETFRRTTDHFISAHLAMCPDPRARVKLDSGENARVVSLEASAPPPPSTDGPWDDLDSDEASDRDAEAQSLPAPPPPVPGAADSRGRSAAPVADAKDGLPSHLPPPPPPPSPAP